MGLAKKIFLNILNIILILSLSVAIMSLTFNMFINEKSLNSLLDDHLEPFIEEQLDNTFEELTPQQIDSQHQTALTKCETQEVYEISRQDNEVINLDCDKVTGTSPNLFIEEIKETLKAHTMNAARSGLEGSLDQLLYFEVAMWLSAALSLFLIVAIIVLVGGFPFRMFGTTGMIAGSPFVIILASQTLIFNKVREEIENSVPSEMLEQVMNSAIIDAVTNLISNLVLGLVVGFGILFIIGLILLIIGLFVDKKAKTKKPTTNPNV